MFANLILAALSEPPYAVMKRRAFNRLIKRLHYGRASPQNSRASS